MKEVVDIFELVGFVVDEVFVFIFMIDVMSDMNFIGVDGEDVCWVIEYDCGFSVI